MADRQDSDRLDEVQQAEDAGDEKLETTDDGSEDETALPRLDVFEEERRRPDDRPWLAPGADERGVGTPDASDPRGGLAPEGVTVDETNLADASGLSKIAGRDRLAPDHHGVGSMFGNKEPDTGGHGAVDDVLGAHTPGKHGSTPDLGSRAPKWDQVGFGVRDIPFVGDVVDALSPKSEKPMNPTEKALAEKAKAEAEGRLKATPPPDPNREATQKQMDAEAERYKKALAEKEAAEKRAAAEKKAKEEADRKKKEEDDKKKKDEDDKKNKDDADKDTKGMPTDDASPAAPPPTAAELEAIVRHQEQVHGGDHINPKDGIGSGSTPDTSDFHPRTGIDPTIALFDGETPQVVVTADGPPPAVNPGNVDGPRPDLPVQVGGTPPTTGGGTGGGGGDPQADVHQTQQAATATDEGEVSSGVHVVGSGGGPAQVAASAEDSAEADDAAALPQLDVFENQKFAMPDERPWLAPEQPAAAPEQATDPRGGLAPDGVDVAAATDLGTIGGRTPTGPDHHGVGERDGDPDIGGGSNQIDDVLGRGSTRQSSGGRGPDADDFVGPGRRSLYADDAGDGDGDDVAGPPSGRPPDPKMAPSGGAGAPPLPEYDGPKGDGGGGAPDRFKPPPEPKLPEYKPPGSKMTDPDAQGGGPVVAPTEEELARWAATRGGDPIRGGDDPNAGGVQGDPSELRPRNWQVVDPNPDDDGGSTLGAPDTPPVVNPGNVDGPRPDLDVDVGFTPPTTGGGTTGGGTGQGDFHQAQQAASADDAGPGGTGVHAVGGSGPAQVAAPADDGGAPAPAAPVHVDASAFPSANLDAPAVQTAPAQSDFADAPDDAAPDAGPPTGPDNPFDADGPDDIG